MMDRKERIRVHLRALRFEIRERAIDTLLIGLPVFLVVGLLMGSVCAWSTIFGMGLCFR